MTVPGPVRAGVETALAGVLGEPTSLADASPVGGGCISPTARVRTEDGHHFFLKWGGSGLPRDMLPAEARGLRTLDHARAVRVPTVIGVGDDGPGWLLLEWLEPGAASPDHWRRLGRELAALHRVHGDAFGADRPNYIGSLPQRNDPTDDWAEFWRDRRLEPQLRAALDSGLLGAADRKGFDALYRRLPELLAPAADDGPSLLHGDLWNGNVHMTTAGPALIDPSVYHGHREVDLAMADLFGGFTHAFHSAYQEAWPLAPGYDPTRRAIYQLYYLLVHVNLFGAGYVSRTRQALERALG